MRPSLGGGGGLCSHQQKTYMCMDKRDGRIEPDMIHIIMTGRNLYNSRLARLDCHNQTVCDL